MDTAPAPRSLTVSADLRRQLERDTVRALLLRPRMLVLPVLVLIVVLSIAVGAVATGTNVASNIAIAVVAVAAFALMAWQQQRRLARVIDAAFPVGAVVTMRLRPDGLQLGSASGTNVIAYGALRGVERHGAVLLLRQHSSGIRLMHPAALFTEDDLAALRQRIG
ncbi:hypothetical protein [Cellulomonas sp. NPDC089187]|uniref:hypothetical protein n=1 Tax=Cellulomonas sp. NPDC089187 TaxID=3154970 RepID=UPI00342892E9